MTQVRKTIDWSGFALGFLYAEYTWEKALRVLECLADGHCLSNKYAQGTLRTFYSPHLTFLAHLQQLTTFMQLLVTILVRIYDECISSSAYVFQFKWMRPMPARSLFAHLCYLLSVERRRKWAKYIQGQMHAKLYFFLSLSLYRYNLYFGFKCSFGFALAISIIYIVFLHRFSQIHL